MSIRRCYKDCCRFAEKCMHPGMFEDCGDEVIEGGSPCKEHALPRGEWQTWTKEQFLDYVDAWHAADWGMPIHVFLGMSEEEYGTWLTDQSYRGEA